jgi:hypothetical protein
LITKQELRIVVNPKYVFVPVRGGATKEAAEILIAQLD